MLLTNDDLKKKYIEPLNDKVGLVWYNKDLVGNKISSKDIATELTKKAIKISNELRMNLKGINKMDEYKKRSYFSLLEKTETKRRKFKTKKIIIF